MNYCSLDDAFPNTEGVPSPGCMAEQAAKQARKEERRKIKRCKDPDRQQYGPLPDIPAMNPSIGMTEHVPVVAPQSEMDSQGWNRSTAEPFEAILPIPPPTKPSMTMDQSQPSAPRKKSFFGADIEDSYADYVPDQKDYQLQPDFLGSFEQTGVQKATGKASILPAASSNMYWKPSTRSGAQTAFIENLPLQKYYQPNGGSEPSMQEVMKRMDMLFAKLDDLNATTPEQMTSELLMFISSGIFVLFMMDLLVKKGSSMRF